MTNKFNVGIQSSYLINEFSVKTPIEDFKYEIITESLDIKREQYLFSISKLKTVAGGVRIFDFTGLKLTELSLDTQKGTNMLKRAKKPIERTDLLMYDSTEEAIREIEFFKKLQLNPIVATISSSYKKDNNHEQTGSAIILPRNKKTLIQFLYQPGILSSIKKRNYEEINKYISLFNRTRKNEQDLIHITPYLEGLLN